MLEVGRSGERIHYRVGKVFGQYPRQPCAEFLYAHTALPPEPFSGNEFKARGPICAEAPHLEDNVIRRMFRDTQNPPHEISLIRPQMHERLLPFPPDFAVKARKLGEPLAVFVDFDAPRCRHRVERLFELSPVVQLALFGNACRKESARKMARVRNSRRIFILK